jgi:CoA:oxalate CoA-transferase
MSQTEEKNFGGPLAGYRILDMTTFLSGPFCTQILADMGAEVVKLESPEGDSSRAIPPHFVDGESAYFLGINRSKKSICIDMKSEEGAACVRRLIGQSDVVVENFRPGVMARLGFNIEESRAASPQLIWASISGFGQHGPWKDQPAYDMIVQALSGVMSLTGEPGRPAVRLGIPAGDMVAGMYAAIAVCAALTDRERTRKGAAIDVSMLDCQLAMLSYQSTYALVAGTHPQPQGARHDSIPTYRSFRARDGRELVVTANTDRMWRGLCKALELDSLVTDPDYATAAARLTNREALWEVLENAFLKCDAIDWIAPLQAQGVPVALIKTVPEALDDARVGQREMIQTLKKEDVSIEVVGNPIKYSTPLPKPTYPPRLGEDTQEVLMTWLGCEQKTIETLCSTAAARSFGGSD